MGVFSDYRSVMRSSREMQRNTDVKGQMADAQGRLEALNATMSQTAAGRALTQGSPARATITAATATGAMINFAPAYEIQLLVMVPGRPPTPVTRTEIIPPLHLSRAQPGHSVAVRVMPDDVHDLVIDWAVA